VATEVFKERPHDLVQPHASRFRDPPAKHMGIALILGRSGCRCILMGKFTHYLGAKGCPREPCLLDGARSGDRYRRVLSHNGCAGLGYCTT
jgi:hypothetical protein